MKYSTVTSAEDWGPAVGKVILDLGAEVDPESVAPERFDVVSVRTAPGADFERKQNTPVRTVRTRRTVTAAYVCDEHGERAASGRYVALELPIGPDRPECSPFQMYMPETLNRWIELHHQVTLTSPLRTPDGKELLPAPTGGRPERNYIPLADEFEKGSHRWTGDGKDITLTWAGWTPRAGAAERSTPLIIWLHGAGEGGTDPDVALIGNKVVNLASEDVQRCFGETGAAVLAPQTPTMWLDVDGTATYRTREDGWRSWYTEALKDLIDAYLARHAEIDPARVYIGGCSNGGYMTVNMLAAYPGFFAAGWPVCTGFFPEWMEEEPAVLSALRDTPMWLTAARTDGVLPMFKGSRDPENPDLYRLERDAQGREICLDTYSCGLYHRLKRAGAKDLHYTLLPKVEDPTGLYFRPDGVTPYEYSGHLSWIYALNNACFDEIGGRQVSLFEWMAQKRL